MCKFDKHAYWYTMDLFLIVWRVPALREFWNMEKIALRQICVSGTVAIYSTNTNLINPLTSTGIMVKNCISGNRGSGNRVSEVPSCNQKEYL